MPTSADAAAAADAIANGNGEDARDVVYQSQRSEQSVRGLRRLRRQLQQ